MTVGLSAANLVTPWLNTMRGNSTNFTGPTALWCQLHVGDPGALGTANPTLLTSTRYQLTFNASAAGSALGLTSSPTAWTAGAGTGETVAYISVWSAASAGTFYYSVALTTGQPWVQTNTFTLSTLSFSLTPQAA